MPDVDLPWEAEVEEIMGIAFGKTDIYDFHALEMMQCMAERRKGGETGVAAVQALSGDAVWKAMSQTSWSAGGWNPRLFEACLSRSQTLAQPKTYSHRYPTPKQMREGVEKPIAHAETMFLSGKAVYPVERTMLTSGMVQFCLQSLSQEEQRKSTTELLVSYQAPEESLYFKK
jgi:hypothetical protein